MDGPGAHGRVRPREYAAIRPGRHRTARTGPSGRRGPRTVAATAVLLLLPGLLLFAWPNWSWPRPAEWTAAGGGAHDRATPPRHRPDPGTLAVGVTHAQYSIDGWSNAEARASAKAVLTATATYQNQHIMGWGALNPQPRPGVYDWSSLDKRMALIRSTGGTPVITLCCAPDWMKGGQAGETDWKRLEAAPDRRHYRDFAELAAAVARRYPDVTHYQVWNELKGFWDEKSNRWDAAAYTDLYNAVYDALKAVDPAIAVGGPYVVLDTWSGGRAGGHASCLAGDWGVVDQRGLDVLDYWLRHKRGADFVALDAGLGTRDQGLAPAARAARASALFGAVTSWVRRRTSLPVWWSEFHVGRADAAAEPQLVSRALAALLHMAGAGASVALVWQPQRSPSTPGPLPPALWTATDGPGGGRPLAYAQALALLRRILADPAGDGPVSWPLPDVGVLHGRTDLLLVNTGGERAAVDVRGQRVQLGPYEIRHVPLPAGAPAAPSGSPTTLPDQCRSPLPAPTRSAGPASTT
ncbi:GH39 family glycosyl hydrolase [Catellatospora bangladeshensis]|uniref:Glycosyl hydrolases family 39 N-terminal catalytic domain-containing protein n=1 Tax=Catellatospora bangladeshensis TaxID=310355 RepID=A0A8J3NMN0_9ACTN|nr:hypothetical protein [Catellatospora bangladeshensis]GIF83945.1 hypothetical protein Cba03nite_52940 [Catellatospora bangladeshensis]